MDNLPTLKPFKPRLEIEETTDRIKVTVTLKPRDKKRRKTTRVTEEDVRLFLEASGLTAGKLHESPTGPLNNQNIEAETITEWSFHKKDLRVKSTPPSASKTYAKSTPPKSSSSRKTKTSSKGK